jgi:gas vesicle protein
MDDGDSGGFPAGFFIGAVTGVLIGFLIAPASGRETRSLLREQAGAGLDRVREAAASAAGRSAPRDE